MHEVLQSVRRLKVGWVLGVHYFEENFLQVCLIGLILNDLTELDSVNLRCHEPLKFVEETLLLGKYRLQSRCNRVAELVLKCCFLILLVIQLLQGEVVVADLTVEHLDALKQRV